MTPSTATAGGNNVTPKQDEHPLNPVNPRQHDQAVQLMQLQELKGEGEKGRTCGEGEKGRTCGFPT